MDLRIRRLPRTRTDRLHVDDFLEIFTSVMSLKIKKNIRTRASNGSCLLHPLSGLVLSELRYTGCHVEDNK